MSNLRRFFIDKINEENVIEGDEFQHAINVLRIKEGEQIILCDNSGIEYFATVQSIYKKHFNAKVFDKQQSQTEPQNKVTLICGYLKGDKTELAVQKAVELGITEIVVFSSEYSSAYANDNKIQRLNKVSLEAAKQCGRAICPKVIYYDNLASALEHASSAENKLFACEFAEKNSVDFSVLKGSVAIVIGSEGGFSKEESLLALDKGYQSVYLGKRILRAETASISLVAIVMHRLGELE